MTSNHVGCLHWCGTPDCFNRCGEPFCLDGCDGYPGVDHDPACDRILQIGDTVQYFTNLDRVRTCGFPAVKGTTLCREHGGDTVPCTLHPAFYASYCPGCGTATTISKDL